MGKNCARGLEYGPRPQAEDTVFRIRTEVIPGP